MIENWKDLVGYWNNTNELYYLVCTYNEGKVILKIEKTNVACNLTEQKLCEQLDAILTSFPQGNYPYSDLGKSRAGNQVARQIRRGFAKTEYNRSIFYRGNSNTDAAVFVIERNGKFGIFKHPDFDQYGFNL